MGKIKDFFEGGGGPISFVLFFVVVLPSFFYIKDCSERDERERRKEVAKARYDSTKMAERDEELRIIREVENRRKDFYGMLSKHCSFFNGYDDFNNWLNNDSSIGAIELLHYIFSQYYDDFDGEDGVERMSRYLGWGGPVFYVECDVCGNETEFIPYE